MILCSTCGNEREAPGRCPFCGEASSGPAPRPSRIVTINLENGRPPAEEALQILERELGAARMQGTRVIRVIHGWGSTGSGGRIRDAVRSRLANHRRDGRISRYVSGEDFPDGTSEARALMNGYPALRQSLRTDTGNPGITFVEVAAGVRRR